jgi:hypothetical protein
MSCVGCYWASELAAVNWAGATAGVRRAREKNREASWAA